MQGGMYVVGLVTGGCMISDLQLHVPHKVAVFIKADDLHRSKDLYRAINQNLLFKLDGGTGFPVEETRPVPNESLLRITQLEAENRGLRQELEASKAQNLTLQTLLQGLQVQFSALQQGITRLEQKEPSVTVVNNSMATASMPGVVGGDTPTFLPGEIKPKDAEASIRVDKQVSEGSSIGAAGKKLRELRGGKSG